MNESTSVNTVKLNKLFLKKRLIYGLFIGLLLASGLFVGLFPNLALLLTVALIATAVGLFFLSHPRWLVLTLSVSLAFRISVDAALGAIVSLQIVLVTGLLLAFVFLFLGDRTSRLLSTPLLGLWLLYVTIGTFAVSRGPSVSAGFQGIWALYRLVWSAPLVYLAIYVFLKTPKHVHQAMSWLSFGGLIGSIVAIVQFLTSGRLLSGLTTNLNYLGLFPPLPAETIAAYRDGTARKLYLAGTNLFRAHGTFLDTNGFGVYLATTIFITWGIAVTSQGKSRWFWYGALLLQGGALGVTFSRSAWLAVVVGIAAITLWKFRYTLKSQRFLLNIARSGIVALILISIVMVRIPTIADHFSTIFSPQEVSEVKWRQIIWNYALEKVKQEPFLGTGKTMIPSDEANIPGRAESYSSHSLLIDIMYQRGFISFFIYMGFWILFFVYGFKLLNSNKYAQNGENLILGLLAAGGAFFVSGVGTPSMIYYNLALLFWSLLGFLIVLSRYSK